MGKRYLFLNTYDHGKRYMKNGYRAADTAYLKPRSSSHYTSLLDPENMGNTLTTIQMSLSQTYMRQILTRSAVNTTTQLCRPWCQSVS